MTRAWRLSGLMLILGALAPSLAVDQDIKEVRKTVPLDRDGRVAINTYKGSVSVRSWDNPQVEIYARVEPDGSGSRWKEKIEDTEIRIDVSAGSVRIESDYEKVKRRSSRFWDLFDGTLPLVHYTVKMPRSARLSIKDYKSKTAVADLRSEVEIDTYKGTVALWGLDGALSLKTYKGDARVQFVNLAGRSRFDTYKGEIEISLPKDKGFDLETDVGRRGSLDSDFQVSIPAGKGFRGSVNGGGPAIHLKTYKGKLRLRRAPVAGAV